MPMILTPYEVPKLLRCGKKSPRRLPENFLQQRTRGEDEEETKKTKPRARTPCDLEESSVFEHFENLRFRRLFRFFNFENLPLNFKHFENIFFFNQSFVFPLILRIFYFKNSMSMFYLWTRFLPIFWFWTF